MLVVLLMVFSGDGLGVVLTAGPCASAIHVGGPPVFGVNLCHDSRFCHSENHGQFEKTIKENERERGRTRRRWVDENRIGKEGRE